MPVLKARRGGGDLRNHPLVKPAEETAELIAYLRSDHLDGVKHPRRRAADALERLAAPPRRMKIGYADPPYIGCAHLYREHADFAGEVDHVALVDRLQSEFDGWVMHAGGHNDSEAILAPLMAKVGARKCIWVKQFAAFKKNVPVAYAWEPVYIMAARKPVVSKRLVMRDWIMCPITMKKGLTGAKPEAVCHWAFEIAAARPDDDLADLFPGTGAVTEAWRTWRGKFTLPALQAAE